MKLSILVIDDEESVRFTFGSFLEKAGYQVWLAENYIEGKKAIYSYKPDLIFLDIHLQGNSALSLIQEAKKVNPESTIIVVTGRPELSSAIDALRLGAFDYLCKPVIKETLLRVAGNISQYKELKEEKQKLLKQKEEYRQHVECIWRSVQDAIITLDMNMMIVHANLATKKICQNIYDESQKPMTQKKSTPCLEMCYPAIHQSLETQKSFHDYCIPICYGTPEEKIVNASGSPLLDENQKIIGFVLVLRDITKISRLERTFQEVEKFYNIIGKSRQMQEIYEILKEVANSDTTVLITGESGTGKEMVARAIHYTGIRKNRPFVAINCAALSETLLESELFGHTKGAFTGAFSDKKGKFEIADGGCLFLDEIGDISPILQAKLLRVLQNKEFERVGDTKMLKMDIKIIAATNSDLKNKIKKGTFREDLYYRLKVLEIKLPPLRERREDIPLLTEHFCLRMCEKFKKNIQGISPETLELFMRYPWPGNIREMENTLEQAFILCHEKMIQPMHLSSEFQEYFHTGKKQDEKILKNRDSTVYREHILEVLEKTKWNKAKASRILKISRQTLYRYMIKYELIAEPSGGKLDMQ